MAKRILLVEDNEDVALALTVRLAGAGFEVRSVTTAMGGIKALDIFEPDLVLLDLLVPGGGGFSVLKALRKAPHTRRVPVIVMTGLEDRDYEAKIRSLGVNALLYKPCDPEALLEGDAGSRAPDRRPHSREDAPPARKERCGALIMWRRARARGS